MFRFLRMIVQKAPLLAAILFIWFLMAVIALAGRSRGYKDYSTNDGMLPGISVVMRGIHDHVLPWGNPAEQDQNGRKDTSSDAEQDQAEDVETDDQAADGQKADRSETDTEKEKEGGAEKSGDSSKEGSKSEGSKSEGSESEGAEKKDSSGEKETDRKASSGKKEQETDPEASSGKKEQETAASQEEQKAETGDGRSLVIPESSCSRVVPAKDYGVADSQYLSPKDTVYNRDTEGLFAPNGIYYSLQKVGDSYFTDALFIGDSRTVGLYEYGGMQETTSFLARESTMVYDLLNDKEKMDYTPKGRKTTEYSMKALLKKAKFRKIYLSVGVNELGIPDTKDYYDEFRKVVKTISTLQPEAVIYIQGIMHVSEEKSRKDRVYNNTAIVQRNEAISTLANGRSIFYIDMNEVLCDENGNLKKELTGDGIHLKASACDLWHKYLLEHAVVVPD